MRLAFLMSLWSSVLLAATPGVAQSATPREYVPQASPRPSPGAITMPLLLLFCIFTRPIEDVSGPLLVTSF